VSCATCHVREKGFADGRARGLGLAEGDRHTPSATLAAHAPFQFWDGRADTLWQQALGPFESAGEMGSSRLFVARRVGAAYAAEYAAVFPRAPLPAMDDLARFPASGKPATRARLTGATGKIWPVAMRRRRAQRASRTATAAASIDAAQTHAMRGSGTGAGR
jgi:hypothetical protein